MEKLLSRWVMKRYLLLWRKFRSRTFESEDALRALRPDTKNVVALCLSELRKAGWLSADFNPDDARRRIYSLKGYQEVLEKITVQIAARR